MANKQMTIRLDPVQHLGRADKLIPYFNSLPYIAAAAGAKGITQAHVIRMALERGFGVIESEAREGGFVFADASDAVEDEEEETCGGPWYPAPGEDGPYGELYCEVHGASCPSPEVVESRERAPARPTEAARTSEEGAEISPVAALMRGAPDYMMIARQRGCIYRNGGWYSPDNKLGPFSRAQDVLDAIHNEASDGSR